MLTNRLQSLECLSGTLHHKIRMSLVILCLLICLAQNTFTSRRYTFVHVSLNLEGPYLGASFWTPPPQSSYVISHFVFCYVSCTKCIYFQEVYFRTCLGVFWGSLINVWRGFPTNQNVCHYSFNSQK